MKFTLPTNSSNEVSFKLKDMGGGTYGIYVDTATTCSTATTTYTVIPILANGGANSAKIATANPNRRALVVYNNSANSIYLSLGVIGNGGTQMTFIVPTFQALTFPQPIYTGDVWATRNAGSGGATVTEFT